MIATQMSINWWTDKQNVIYVYSGILFSLKQEGNPVTWALRKLFSLKKESHKKTNTVWFHLYELLKVDKYIETENRMVGAGGRRVKYGLVMGIQYSFSFLWKVLEICYRILWIPLTLLNHTLKNRISLVFHHYLNFLNLLFKKRYAINYMLKNYWTIQLKQSTWTIFFLAIQWQMWLKTACKIKRKRSTYKLRL